MPEQTDTATTTNAADIWLSSLAFWQQFTPAVPNLAPKTLDQSNTSSVVSGGQLALFATTVNQQATSNPGLEEQIVTQVASYGKQLGRVIEAVEVLTRKIARPTDDEDKDALKALTDLAGEIRSARAAYARSHVEQIVDSIKLLGRSEHVDHQALRRIGRLADKLDQQD